MFFNPRSIPLAPPLAYVLPIESPTDMKILTDEQLDDFALNGYAVSKEPLLSDAEVEELRDELQAVIEGRGKGSPVLNRNMKAEATEYGEASGEAKLEVRQIVNICEASEAFDRLIRNQNLAATVSRLCNNAPVLRLWHDQIQYKPPVHGGMTAWHQDFLAWPVIEPGDLVSAWIALDDADVENGCMWMVPGSHRWGAVAPKTDLPNGFRPVYDPELIPEGVEVKHVPMPVKKGHVGFHHCMTWHGSPPNPSPRPRRAFAIHYMPGHTIFAPRGRNHPAARNVHVSPGEILEGDSFPILYQNEKAMSVFRRRYVNEPAAAAA